jgi:hypothetical protein
MPERRTDERRRVLKAGKIVWNEGGSVLDCTLRNVSKTGALLGVVNAVAAEKFELHWGGTTQHCMVVWRKLDRIGIKFAP